jgi:hypothetical protein
MRKWKSQVRSLFGVSLSVLLVAVSLAGCRPSISETGTYVSDAGAQYEPIEVFPQNGMTLMSRPLNWRSAGAEKGTQWRELDANDATGANFNGVIEYHGGYVYFAMDDNMTIRRIPQTGEAMTFFTSQERLANWHVSLGAKYIAACHYPSTHIDIWSTSTGKLVQTINAKTYKTAATGDVVLAKFGAWSFSGADHADISTFTTAIIPAEFETSNSPSPHASDIVSFVQVHIDKHGHPTVSTVSVAAGIHIQSWRHFAFDPKNDVAAWDTCPGSLEIWQSSDNPSSAVDFLGSKVPVDLSVYSLRTGTAHVIAEGPSIVFDPHWVAPGALEFYDGKERVVCKDVTSVFDNDVPSGM